MARTARKANSIIFNARVEKIECASAGEHKQCQVHTSDGKTYTANGVIVTVPLGVLKKDFIQFEPPLPAHIQDSIQHLGYGSLDKVYSLPKYSTCTTRTKLTQLPRLTLLFQRLSVVKTIHHIMRFLPPILIQTRTGPHGNNLPSRSLI